MKLLSFLSHENSEQNSAEVVSTNCNETGVNDDILLKSEVM
jgi:hypothetical protein